MVLFNSHMFVNDYIMNISSGQAYVSLSNLADHVIVICPFLGGYFLKLLLEYVGAM